ncbi:MAG: STM4015 family protein [Gemmataceae bacterium]|nr:STM4015 family protein [Gemmataceae bacterium]
MGIGSHATTFGGKRVRAYDPDKGLKDAGRTCPRLALTLDELEEAEGAEDGNLFTDRLAAFLAEPEVSKVTDLVIGNWEHFDEGESDSSFIVEALVAARAKLSNLKALFLGDIIQEECEISWIHQSDVSPLFKAYPGLEEFRVRGGDGLSLGKVKHKALKSLAIESGGLPVSVLRDVCAANLPELEHLGLWLGADNYGGDATVQDLKPLLAGKKFPKLRTLGLCDSEKADEVAAAVARAPILERLSVLDLSLGNLTDEGAQALLDSPAVAKLKRLDLHHHYVSKAMVKKLKALGTQVDASEEQKPWVDDDEVHRFIAVSE